MSRGPTFRKLIFSREEVLREHKWEPPTKSVKVVPPFQRKTDDLPVTSDWMD